MAAVAAAPASLPFADSKPGAVVTPASAASDASHPHARAATRCQPSSGQAQIDTPGCQPVGCGFLGNDCVVSQLLLDPGLRVGLARQTDGCSDPRGAILSEQNVQEMSQREFESLQMDKLEAKVAALTEAHRELLAVVHDVCEQVCGLSMTVDRTCCVLDRAGADSDAKTWDVAREHRVGSSDSSEWSPSVQPRESGGRPNELDEMERLIQVVIRAQRQLVDSSVPITKPARDSDSEFRFLHGVADSPTPSTGGLDLEGIVSSKPCTPVLPAQAFTRSPEADIQPTQACSSLERLAQVQLELGLSRDISDLSRRIDGLEDKMVEVGSKPVEDIDEKVRSLSEDCKGNAEEIKMLSRNVAIASCGLDNVRTSLADMAERLHGALDADKAAAVNLKGPGDIARILSRLRSLELSLPREVDDLAKRVQEFERQLRNLRPELMAIAKGCVAGLKCDATVCNDHRDVADARSAQKDSGHCGRDLHNYFKQLEGLLEERVADEIDSEMLSVAISTDSPSSCGGKLPADYEACASGKRQAEPHKVCGTSREVEGSACPIPGIEARRNLAKALEDAEFSESDLQLTKELVSSWQSGAAAERPRIGIRSPSASSRVVVSTARAVERSKQQAAEAGRAAVELQRLQSHCPSSQQESLSDGAAPAPTLAGTSAITGPRVVSDMVESRSPPSSAAPTSRSTAAFDATQTGVRVNVFASPSESTKCPVARRPSSASSPRTEAAPGLRCPSTPTCLPVAVRRTTGFAGEDIGAESSSPSVDKPRRSSSLGSLRPPPRLPQMPMPQEHAPLAWRQAGPRKA